MDYKNSKVSKYLKLLTGTIVRLNLSIILVLISLSIACQVSDAWEKRQNDRQPPDKVMDAIGIEPGMIIGEVGAGRGRYVVHMAVRTGPGGKVFAEDIDAEALNYLKYRCEHDNITNVVTILGEVTNPKLPEGMMDVIYMINSYHHISDVVPLMKNIIPSLKPGGKFVIIENEPGKSGWNSHTTPKEKLLRETKEAGFQLVKMIDILDEDMIYVFKVVN